MHGHLAFGPTWKYNKVQMTLCPDCKLPTNILPNDHIVQNCNVARYVFSTLNQYFCNKLNLADLTFFQAWMCTSTPTKLNLGKPFKPPLPIGDQRKYAAYHLAFTAKRHIYHSFTSRTQGTTIQQRQYNSMPLNTLLDNILQDFESQVDNARQNPTWATHWAKCLV